VLQSRPNRPVDTQLADPMANRVIDDLYRLIGKLQAEVAALSGSTTPASTVVRVGTLDGTAAQGVLRGEGGAVLGGSEHSDLAGIGANDHHNQAHEVLDTDDHSDAVVGLEFYIRNLADGHVLTWDATNGYWYNKAP
jgi:hypothetical protein